MSKLYIPIPEDIALQICEEIREKNKKKKYSFLIFAKEDNRGCHLVNKIFDTKY